MVDFPEYSHSQTPQTSSAQQLACSTSGSGLIFRACKVSKANSSILLDTTPPMITRANESHWSVEDQVVFRFYPKFSPRSKALITTCGHGRGFHPWDSAERDLLSRMVPVSRFSQYSCPIVKTFLTGCAIDLWYSPHTLGFPREIQKRPWSISRLPPADWERHEHTFGGAVPKYRRYEINRRCCPGTYEDKAGEKAGNFRVPESWFCRRMQKAYSGSGGKSITFLCVFVSASSNLFGIVSRGAGRRQCQFHPNVDPKSGRRWYHHGWWKETRSGHDYLRDWIRRVSQTFFPYQSTK